MPVYYVDGSQSSTLPVTAKQAARVACISGDIKLANYNFPLPRLATIVGNLHLGSPTRYPHPLPALRSVNGDLNVVNYDHPLPCLRYVGGRIEHTNYPYSFANVANLIIA